MPIEQIYPKKPNFALVFGLSGVALVVILAAVVLLFHTTAGRDLIPHHHIAAQAPSANPTN